MSLELQQRIPEDPAGGIHYRFFQVLIPALLFPFDANFVKFHGVFGFLGHPKIRAMAHAEIEGFSTYRAGYTRKMPSQSCTYATVWKTITYVAALKVFQVF